MRVRRVDASLLERFERTPSGGLRIPATPARVGVQVYKQPDGSERREYRPAEEVFAAKSLATYRGAPLTDLHPAERGDAAAVTPSNFRRLVVGHVCDNVAHSDSHVTCEVVLHDATIIEKVEQGFARELSCGYSCEWDPTPGVSPEGERYDGIQRNIEINHVALGPMGWARAGASASLRLDAADMLYDCGPGKPGPCAAGESPVAQSDKASIASGRAKAASFGAKDSSPKDQKHAADMHEAAAKAHDAARAVSPDQASRDFHAHHSDVHRERAAEHRSAAKTAAKSKRSDMRATLFALARKRISTQGAA